MEEIVIYNFFNVFFPKHINNESLCFLLLFLGPFL